MKQCVLTLIVIASLMIGVVRAQDAKRELEKQADEILQYLMGSLEIPLWLINDDTVRVIGKSVAQNEFVVQLICHICSKTIALMSYWAW